MRPLLIPFSLWLVALQVPYPASEIHGLAGVGEFLSLAAALAAFTVPLYRLGVGDRKCTIRKTASIRRSRTIAKSCTRSALVLTMPLSRRAGERCGHEGGLVILHLGTAGCSRRVVGR